MNQLRIYYHKPRVLKQPKKKEKKLEKKQIFVWTAVDFEGMPDMGF